MSTSIQNVVDTLSNKPEVGVFGSMVGVAFSPTAIISLISASIGLIVAVITVIIKIMDLYAKIQDKKVKAVQADATEYKIIDGVKFKRVEVNTEE